MINWQNWCDHVIRLGNISFRHILLLVSILFCVTDDWCFLQKTLQRLSMLFLVAHFWLVCGTDDWCSLQKMHREKSAAHGDYSGWTWRPLPGLCLQLFSAWDRLLRWYIMMFLFGYFLSSLIIIHFLLGGRGGELLIMLAIPCRTRNFK